MKTHWCALDLFDLDYMFSYWFHSFHVVTNYSCVHYIPTPQKNHLDNIFESLKQTYTHTLHVDINFEVQDVDFSILETQDQC